MSQLRTFLAAEIGPDVAGRAQKLVNKLKAASTAKVSWVRPGELHFTLSFLGEIVDREIPQLLKAVSDAVRELPAFDLICRGVGVFPSLDNPRTIWLGVTDGYDEMIELHARLEQALVPLGIRGEGRRYRPHLTLGRIRQSDTGMIELREQLAAFEDYEAGIMTVSEVTVFHSDLRSSGPEYAALGHAELLG